MDPLLVINLTPLPKLFLAPGVFWAGAGKLLSSDTSNPDIFYRILILRPEWLLDPTNIFRLEVYCSVALHRNLSFRRCLCNIVFKNFKSNRKRSETRAKTTTAQRSESSQYLSYHKINEIARIGFLNN
ncbi:hypothetical protein TNCV_1222741 [Trichonephila clavipes]|nr:hypothetical protein TNCV_1222741 [Trichonephila clavipes]